MTTIFIACSRWLRRQGTRQPTSPRAAADEWAAPARTASAPQAGDEGSSGSTKDRQGRRTFVGTRSGEPSRDCLHTGQAGRPWPERSAPARGTRGSIGATARGRDPLHQVDGGVARSASIVRTGAPRVTCAIKPLLHCRTTLARAMQRSPTGALRWTGRLDEEIRP
jgi:hypothetical protein